MDQHRPLIVFSDLDGTLLDHGTYSYRAAEPALHLLRERAVPLVLASSKTAAEIGPLRAELGFDHCPAIVENGAGVLEPAGERARDRGQSTYRRLRTLVDQAPEGLRRHFKGFGDMGAAGIAAATGLDRGAATAAGRRRFSEPGVWSGSDTERDAFTDWLAARGVRARSGGRFLTLSFGGTKAERMDEITKALCGDRDPFVVALGDAPNDREMLEKADRAFIIANPHGTPVPKLSGEDDGSITRTTKTGPAGWNDAIQSVVSTSRDNGGNWDRAKD